MSSVIIEPDPRVWIELPSQADEAWAQLTAMELFAAQPSATVTQADLVTKLRLFLDLDRTNEPSWRLLYLRDVNSPGVVVDVDVFVEAAEEDFARIERDVEPFAEMSVQGARVIHTLWGMGTPDGPAPAGVSPVFGEFRIVVLARGERLIATLGGVSPYFELLEEAAAFSLELAATIRPDAEGGIDVS